MSKNKGNKNNKKAKAVGKTKVLSAYQRENQKGQPAIDVLAPKANNKTAKEQKNNK